MMSIFPFIAEIGKQWLSNKRAKSEAKHEREIKVIRGEAEADVKSADGMSSTLKDEYLTLILTIPLIVIFYSAVWGDPAMIERVKLAFAVMSELPEWYQWSFWGCVAATFGIRTLKFFGGK